LQKIINLVLSEKAQYVSIVRINFRNVNTNLSVFSSIFQCENTFFIYGKMEKHIICKKPLKSLETGMSARPNASADPVTANGCGSYGYVVPSYLLPVMSSCCDAHDICYGTCGVSMRDCDDIFDDCLKSVCGGLRRQLSDPDNSTLLSGKRFLCYTERTEKVTRFL